MGNNRISEDTLNKLKELGVTSLHINNGGKELTDEDYLHAVTVINETLKKLKSKNTLHK